MKIIWSELGENVNHNLNRYLKKAEQKVYILFRLASVDIKSSNRIYFMLWYRNRKSECTKGVRGSAIQLALGKQKQNKKQVFERCWRKSVAPDFGELQMELCFHPVTVWKPWSPGLGYKVQYRKEQVFTH